MIKTFLKQSFLLPFSSIVLTPLVPKDHFRSNQVFEYKHYTKDSDSLRYHFTNIGNILEISSSVNYGNKIQKSFSVTCGVTQDNWMVTLYVVVMVLVRVNMHDVTAHVKRHQVKIMKVKAHIGKRPNFTERHLRERNQTKFQCEDGTIKIGTQELLS